MVETVFFPTIWFKWLKVTLKTILHGVNFIILGFQSALSLWNTFLPNYYYCNNQTNHWKTMSGSLSINTFVKWLLYHEQQDCESINTKLIFVFIHVECKHEAYDIENEVILSNRNGIWNGIWLATVKQNSLKSWQWGFYFQKKKKCFII